MFADVAVEVQDRLVKYLDVLEQAVKATTDFAADQTPLVVQELILWTRVESTMFAIFSVVGVLSILYLIRSIWKCGYEKAEKVVDDMQPEYVVPCVFLGVFLVLAFVCFVNNSMYCAKTWCAPRLIVLEEVKNMVKGNQ